MCARKINITKTRYLLKNEITKKLYQYSAKYVFDRIEKQKS